jgi:hypothetical protein
MVLSFLTSALDGVNGQLHTITTLLLGKQLLLPIVQKIVCAP